MNDTYIIKIQMRELTLLWLVSWWFVVFSSAMPSAYWRLIAVLCLLFPTAISMSYSLYYICDPIGSTRPLTRFNAANAAILLFLIIAKLYGVVLSYQANGANWALSTRSMFYGGIIEFLQLLILITPWIIAYKLIRR